MIPILNPQNEVEFDLVLGGKITRSLPILKSFKLWVKLIAIYQSNSTQYPEIKSFIEEIFYRSYKAKISVNFPKIMTLTNKNDELVSAVGFREAKNGKLFLEQYLKNKVEETLAVLVGSKVERDSVIEIGSLASNRKNAAQFLYVALSAYLKKKGYKYAVMTSTDYLRKYFEKAGLKPQIIADADRSKLEDQKVDWGFYYETNPKVMVLDVANGYRALNRFLGIDVIPSRTRLYPKIYYV